MVPMIDFIFYTVFPYAAIVIALAVTLHRFVSTRVTRAPLVLERERIFRG